MPGPLKGNDDYVRTAVQNFKNWQWEAAKVGQEVAIYESMGYLGGKQFYSIEKPAPPIKFTIGKKASY